MLETGTKREAQIIETALKYQLRAQGHILDEDGNDYSDASRVSTNLPVVNDVVYNSSVDLGKWIANGGSIRELTRDLTAVELKDRAVAIANLFNIGVIVRKDPRYARPAKVVLAPTKANDYDREITIFLKSIGFVLLVASW